MIKEDIKEYERNSVYKGTEHKDYGRNASKCIDKTTGRKVIIREYNRSDFNTNAENGICVCLNDLLLPLFVNISLPFFWTAPKS